MKRFFFPDGIVGDSPSSKHNFRMLMALLSVFAVLILVALLLTGCAPGWCSDGCSCYDYIFHHEKC